MTTMELPPVAAPTPRGRRRSGPQPFDFRRPNKISREHVRALQIVHETFARQFATVLTTMLRSVCSVTVAGVDHLTYDEYVRSCPNPSLLAVLAVPPLPGLGVLQLPLPVAMTVVDRLLGGTGDTHQPERSLTDIETLLLRELVGRLLREIDYAFESLATVQSAMRAIESNPQFLQVTAPSQMVVVATYDVRIGSLEQTASMCLPLAALLPTLEQLTGRQVVADRPGVDPLATTRALSARLQGAPVDVAVRFAPVTLTSAEILGLQVGDVLPLHHPLSMPLAVTAARQTCALAVPGSKGRRLAFLVVQPEDGTPEEKDPLR